MKLLIQDRILTEAKNISQLRKINPQNFILFTLRWCRLRLLIKVRNFCIHKLARFRQRNFNVLLVSPIGGRTCYILVLHLRIFLWLCEKCKHISFSCTISFHIEKCSGLDLLFRREILKKNIGILPLYLRGSCMLFWVMSAF